MYINTGTEIQIQDVPENLISEMEDRRKELVDQLVDVDEELGEMFLNEIEPTVEDIKKAIRRQTIKRTFVPLFMGSAFKNKGVQLLLDGVNDYLPSPAEVKNEALDLGNDEAKVAMKCDPDLPLV